MLKFWPIMLVCATICLTGCFSIETSREPGNSKTQVIASNYGWYLFDWIPLACGDTDEDRIIPCTFFNNQVKMDIIQDRLIGKLQQNGQHIEDLVWKNNDSVLMTLPLLSIPIPIPYIITYREMQLSGEVR